jgi:simple sugar transport system ATP-binding protein
MVTEDRSGRRDVGAASEVIPVLDARGITKVFSGEPANQDVDIELRAGTVHALLGENGAGKTTLANVISGLYRPDAGELRVRGESVDFGSPLHALEHGVGMVHQHPLLVDRFTVEENITLGDRDQPFFRSGHATRKQVTELIDKYGLHVKVRAVVGEMTAGERQRVEILKMLYRGVRVLLLDEPTSVLAPSEAEALFTTIRSFASDGVAILIITHKLREVMAISDVVTVMRAGRVVACDPIGDVNPSLLAERMVGRALDPDFVRVESSVAPGTPVFAAARVSVPGTTTREGIYDLSLEVRSSEIVAVAGVAGNGQGVLAEVLAGSMPPSSGTVSIRGGVISGLGPAGARAHGLAYVPADRTRTGLAPDLTIEENVALTATEGFLFRRKDVRRRGLEAMQQFGIRAEGPGTGTRLLSGGNQQRLLLARELNGSPGALVVASPTHGLDVASAQFVHAELRRLRNAGAAIVLISEDLDEIMALADRILVIYEGRLVHESPAAGADPRVLGLAMAGAL